MKSSMREADAMAMAVERQSKSKRGDALVEAWSKVPIVGAKFKESYDVNPRAMRNTAILLENMARELSKMNEVQVSSAYNGLTPENALRVVRLGYPNSHRAVFSDIAMETAEDGVWYVSPVYGSTTRGATAETVTHESGNYTYAGNEEIESFTQTPNGAITTFTGSATGNVANPPLKPFHVRIYQNSAIIAQDDGSGTISGSLLSAGTINYTSGALSITFSVAPATGTVLQVGYVYDYEDTTQYGDLGDVELRLRKVNLKLRSFRLGLSWSKQSELTLGTTLDLDAEELLVKSASEELIKALDFDAFKLGYRVSLGNTYRTFDADYLSRGADSPFAHAQSLNRVFEDSADDIRNSINRGGISAFVVGSQVGNYMSSYMNKFSSDGKDMQEIGVYQLGTYDGKPVLKAPTSVLPANEMYTIYNNEVAGDYAIIIGTLLPMYQSPKIEYKTMNSELGLAEWGDRQIGNSKYIRRIVLSNLDQY